MASNYLLEQSEFVLENGTDHLLSEAGDIIGLEGSAALATDQLLMESGDLLELEGVDTNAVTDTEDGTLAEAELAAATPGAADAVALTDAAALAVAAVDTGTLADTNAGSATLVDAEAGTLGLVGAMGVEGQDAGTGSEAGVVAQIELSLGADTLTLAEGLTLAQLEDARYGATLAEDATAVPSEQAVDSDTATLALEDGAVDAVAPPTPPVDTGTPATGGWAAIGPQRPRRRPRVQTAAERAAEEAEERARRQRAIAELLLTVLADV